MVTPSHEVLRAQKGERTLPSGFAVRIGLVAFSAVVLLLPAVASAQMYERAWDFTPRDRAGLAVVQKQVESGAFSSSNGTISSGTSASGSNSTLLLCGGDGGDSSATANSSCIILNNATGDLVIGQDAVGDQSANASSETTSSTVADEVTQILDSSNEAATGSTE